MMNSTNSHRTQSRLVAESSSSRGSPLKDRMGSRERTDLSMLGVKFRYQVAEVVELRIQFIVGLHSKTNKEMQHFLEEVEIQPPSATTLEADIQMEWVLWEASLTKTKEAVHLSKDPPELELAVMVQLQVVGMEQTIRVVPQEQVRILNSRIIRITQDKRTQIIINNIEYNNYQ